MSKHRHRLILAAILLWATFLRLWQCDSALPGLQIDDASNAWNAQCLLKTGMDEWGKPWPIFATRAFDDYRSPLYLYFLMPFQAIGGMNVCTTRLPAAIGGVVTVGLIYWLGRRMFDPATGLIASALLAAAPWHIQFTRWGHEANIGPLLSAIAFIALIASGAPCIDRPARPRAWPALICGLVIGITCCGYAAVRIFVPVNILAIGVATSPRWWPLVQTRAGLKWFVLLLAGVILVVGPLLWAHISDPDMNSRAHETQVWQPTDSPLVAAGKVLLRLPRHFSPQGLFTRVPTVQTLDTPGGPLHWFMLPLLAAGVAWLIAGARVSVSARMLIAMLALYPAGDIAFSGTQELVHPLRCLPGIIALCLTGAVGGVAAFRWLAARSHMLARSCAAALAAWAMASHAIFLSQYFGPFSHETDRMLMRHVDLMQACEYLKPRLPDVDAVFITQDDAFIPHCNLLVWLGYDPRDWFAQPREYAIGRFPYFNRQVCTKFGKVRIMYGTTEAQPELDALAANGRPDRVVMFLRPWQTELARGAKPALVIGQSQDVWLLVYDMEM